MFQRQPSSAVVSGDPGYSARDPEGNVWSFGSDDPPAWNPAA